MKFIASPQEICTSKCQTDCLLFGVNFKIICNIFENNTKIQLLVSPLSFDVDG